MPDKEQHNGISCSSAEYTEVRVLLTGRPVQGVARMLRTQAADRAAIQRFAGEAQWSDEEGGAADEYNDEYDDSFDDLQGGAADGVADVEGAFWGLGSRF